ncbi:MAG TPA: hypothetical protein G4O07_00780 [Dehalococcoidia bacterium]|nr:hypothetical protein [Dehalococcoidia bacterium]
MSTPGYNGTILYVNLTDGSTRVEQLDPDLVQTLIGGFGINNRLMYDLMPADVDPLSPENLIIVAAGPFAGTMIPGGAKVVITTRFPINGAIATAAGGGSFAPFMKWAGIDHMVISGRAKQPVFLKVSQGQYSLEDASDLWGRDTYETTDILRKRYEPCSVIAMGQSGESLVKNSTAFVDKAGTIGRGGLPAVMGSKNLKAIVVEQGEVPVQIADRAALHRLVNKLHERIMNWPGRQLIQENGLMPAPPDLSEIHLRTRSPLACPSCPLADKVMVCLDEGPYAGLQTYMPHFATTRLGATDSAQAYENSIRYSDALNRYGIGGTNFSGFFGQIVDLFQEGIITIEDTGGLELRNDIDTAIQLIRMTASQEGFGKVIAEGPEAIARLIGSSGEEYISHIKGLGVVYDPRMRGLGTMEFEEITSPRGAHVSAAGSPSYDSGRTLVDFIRHGERMGAPAESLKRMEEAGVFNPGIYSRYSEDWYALFNSLSLCNRAQVNRFYHVNTIAELYSALTGIQVSPQQLMHLAERAWTMGKLLNVREGFDRRQDRAPETWFRPLVRDGQEYRLHDYQGTAELDRQDVERYLDDYYQERGYDKETGLPTINKLTELGLEDIGRELNLPDR